MSFKWKWLLTTFLAQLLLGSIFTAIQFFHMGNVAEAQLDQVRSGFQAELNRLEVGRQTYSMNTLSSVIRDFYSRYKPVSVWVHADGQQVYTLGDITELPEHVENGLLSTFSLPTPGHHLSVLFDSREVFRSRNDMVSYLAGIFLLGAVGCAIILLGLSNTLSRRLEDLRSKAMELQSGNIQSRILVTGRDEISCLGEAFNSMAQAIQAQMSAKEEAHARSVSEKIGWTFCFRPWEAEWPIWMKISGFCT